MENICFGREIGEEEVMAAAKDACAYDFIMEKEDGFLSEAAIGGANLSGGQKQRLLITRALAGKPDFLSRVYPPRRMRHDTRTKRLKTQCAGEFPLHPHR